MLNRTTNGRRGVFAAVAVGVLALVAAACDGRSSQPAAGEAMRACVSNVDRTVRLVADDVTCAASETLLFLSNGAHGPDGAAGPAGPAGPDGVDAVGVGPVGPDGPVGEPGPAGERGPQGETGPQGPVGPAGPDGPVGPKGVNGEDSSEEGERGPIGDRGERGPRGVDGAPWLFSGPVHSRAAHLTLSPGVDGFNTAAGPVLAGDVGTMFLRVIGSAGSGWCRADGLGQTSSDLMSFPVQEGEDFIYMLPFRAEVDGQAGLNMICESDDGLSLTIDMMFMIENRDTPAGF